MTAGQHRIQRRTCPYPTNSSALTVGEVGTGADAVDGTESGAVGIAGADGIGTVTDVVALVTNELLTLDT